MDDVELINTAIDESGLSARKFAEKVMTRDERTIRRWQGGQQAIPEVGRRRLQWFLALSQAMRARLMAILDR